MLMHPKPEGKAWKQRFDVLIYKLSLVNLVFLLYVNLPLNEQNKDQRK